MGKDSGFKAASKFAGAAAFFLTLITWIFFYKVLPDAPLNAQSTPVVFAVWFLLSAAAWWLWHRFRSTHPKH